MNLLLVVADGERELKNVVRLTELNLPLPIGSWFETVDDHIERFALQSRHQRLPIRRHELRLSSHRSGEGIDHLFFVTDVLIGVIWIVVDVRRAAAGIGAPAERLLSDRLSRQQRQYDQSKQTGCN